MHKDIYGLPVQADGDANDQLQRVGMILTAEALRRQFLYNDNLQGLAYFNLQSPPGSGIYKRHTLGNTNNVSADQLIAIMGAHVALGDSDALMAMLKQMAKRAGFAQNYIDGLDGDVNGHPKVPDFMLLRALPFAVRYSKLLYPLALVTDIYLVVAALSACGPVWADGSLVPHKRSLDDVDHNNTILTLAVAAKVRPTPFSLLAAWLFGKLCPANYGGEPAVMGALVWYHRAESGGNPEIAEMWRPLVQEIF